MMRIMAHTGLIPQSAPMMEYIVDFWREYYQEDGDNFIGGENILAQGGQRNKNEG